MSDSKIDVRETFNNEKNHKVKESTNIADISPKKLRTIRKELSGGGDDAVEVAKRVQEEELSIEDVEKVRQWRHRSRFDGLSVSSPFCIGVLGA